MSHYELAENRRLRASGGLSSLTDSTRTPRRTTPSEPTPKTVTYTPPTAALFSDFSYFILGVNNYTKHAARSPNPVICHLPHTGTPRFSAHESPPALARESVRARDKWAADPIPLARTRTHSPSRQHTCVAEAVNPKRATGIRRKTRPRYRRSGGHTPLTGTHGGGGGGKANIYLNP